MRRRQLGVTGAGPRAMLLGFLLVPVYLYVDSYIDSSDVKPEAPAAVGRSPAGATGGLKSYGDAQVRITMYSLTTCGYSQAMRQALKARNIPFVERFLDADPAAREELQAKLTRAGFQPGAIGTPTLDVNGTMLSNPSIGAVLGRLGL